jgi:diguanylate cyclase (GGDEF)-like protein
MDFILDLIKLDSKSMIGILVWCNFALSILIFGYRFTRTEIYEKRVIALYGYAKLFQGVAWLLLFERLYLTLLWSRFIGNNILFIGFFLESLVMLALTRMLFKKTFIVQSLILIISCVVFGILAVGTEDYIYVIVASIVTFFIYLYPTIAFMYSKGDRFKKFLGLGYVFFLVVMVLRALSSYMDVTMSLFTVNYVQHFSFITLILLTVISGPGFLLLLKERADVELRILATLDGLTHISNRRHFLEQAQLIFVEHQKVQLPLSVLFIDIDHFKLVNDQHGHGFGDEVLINLADILKGAIRGSDLVCRYGGEEFVVLLVDTNIEGSRVVIDHIRDHIKQAQLSLPDFKYSISIGLYATIPPEGSMYDFIKKSDEAMYQAKQFGRDQYVVYGENNV